MSESFGLEYIEVAPGLVVDGNGEIVEDGSGDGLLRVAQLRHEAYVQKRAFESYIEDLDRVLLKQQSEKKVAYGTVVCSVRGGTYTKVDSAQFADLVYERFTSAFAVFDAEADQAVAAVLAIVAAATGFKREALPEPAWALLDAATTTLTKRPWVETSVARHEAPVRRLVAAPAEEVA